MTAPPRFDVVVTSYQGEGRPRYCVRDRQTWQTRFPLDPFDREQARALCDRLNRGEGAGSEAAPPALERTAPQGGHEMTTRQETRNPTTEEAGAIVSRRPCQSCGKPLVFVRTAAGKLAPMEADAQGQPTDVNHFRTCPEAGKFARSPYKGGWPKQRPEHRGARP